MSHMGHNPKVPIRIHEGYPQIILKFAKCDLRVREEETGLWIMEYFQLGPTLTEYSIIHHPFSWLKMSQVWHLLWHLQYFMEFNDH